jgi:hypothetical protein
MTAAKSKRSTPTNRRLWLREMIHCRQPLVFWQPLSCFFGNLWVVHQPELPIPLLAGRNYCKSKWA